MTGNSRNLFHTEHDYESSGFVDYGQNYNNEYLTEMNNLVTFRNENVVRASPYKSILSTNSLYEVKIWLNLMGLKFKVWKQQEYYFETGTNGIQLMFIVEFESLITFK